MSTSSLRVIVIGGGIGGLCLSQALKSANVSVAVYERDPSPTDWLQGYQITLNPVGGRALRECLPPILWEAFTLTAGKPSNSLSFLDEQLKELLHVDEKRIAGGANGSEKTTYPISRIALRHMLLTGLEDILHFGKTFVRYEQSTTGKVTAFFADGTSVTGDILVAADGANSSVRKQYLPHAQRTETDALTIGGKLPLNEQTRVWLPSQLSKGVNMITPLKRYQMFLSVVDHGSSHTGERDRINEKLKAAGLQTELLFHDVDDYLLWAFAAHREAFPAGVVSFDKNELQQLMYEMIYDWHPDLRRVIRDSDASSVGFISLKTSVPIEAWKTTYVTLLGDAVHSMTPLAGMGANTALRDAYALARTLITVNRGEASLLPALSAYEALMREYGFAAVRTSIRNTERAISTNPLERLTARAWFKLSNTFPALQDKQFGNELPELEKIPIHHVK